MRYAIISDIHGNRQALNVVLTDIRSNRIDCIICLGDIVGYGPSPKETVENCYQYVNYFVLGNHDAAVAGKISTENFNDNAKFLINWTLSRLEEGHKKFLSSASLLLKGKDFRCAHGSLKNPGRFSYILEEDEAREEFAGFPEKLAFVGHSHVPGLFVIGDSGNPHWLEPTNFNLEDEKRYIVNVGSVGQPRDDDVRASYCIYDQERGDVLFRKIPFDIEAYRRDQAKCNLPENSSYFVEFYLTNKPKPLRETVGFRELSADQAVRGAEELKNLEDEVKKLRNNKKLLLTIILLCVIISFGLLALYFKIEAEKRKIAEAERLAKQQLAKKNKTICDGVERDFAILPPIQGTEIIKMPNAIMVASKENPIKDWKIELSEPEKQKVSSEIFTDKKLGELPGFKISSENIDEVILKYKPVPVRKGMRFSASAQFKKVSLNSGHISLCLLLEKSDGTTQLLAQNIVDELKESEGWTRKTSVTLSKDDPIKDDGFLYFAVKGNFIGEVLVRKCSLIEK